MTLRKIPKKSGKILFHSAQTIQHSLTKDKKDKDYQAVTLKA
jgi:hypothetical protein